MSKHFGRCVLATLAIGVAGPGCQLNTNAATSPTHSAPAPADTANATGTVADGRYLPPAPTRSGPCRFQGAGDLPDPACTPGATDPAVTEANIDSTICVQGYTKRVRPPVAVTDQIKRDRMAAYGVATPASSSELDHLIPLEVGGAPQSVANLWPEPWNGADGAHAKDKVENRLHELVCAHQLSLADAQRAIATNWQSAASQYGAGASSSGGYSSRGSGGSAG